MLMPASSCLLTVAMSLLFVMHSLSGIEFFQELYQLLSHAAESGDLESLLEVTVGARVPPD